MWAKRTNLRKRECAEDGDESEVVKEVGEATHIADGVKCYLRDIGKIPLLIKRPNPLSQTK